MCCIILVFFFILKENKLNWIILPFVTDIAIAAGTATGSGTDYTEITATTATFGVGVDFVEKTLLITEDTLKEDVETLTLSLTGPNMGVIAEPDLSTVFIIDESGKMANSIWIPHTPCGRFKNYLLQGECDVNSKYTAQLKFPNSNFRELNLKTHISLGEMKIVKGCTIYFCTFWHLNRWNPLTNDGDMVISLLLEQVSKMTPEPIPQNNRQNLLIETSNTIKNASNTKKKKHETEKTTTFSLLLVKHFYLFNLLPVLSPKLKLVSPPSIRPRMCFGKWRSI